MTTTPDGSPLAHRARAMLFHLCCVLALVWPAFANGHPFFFPDTTAYVRAADIAVYLASGSRIRTEWTNRYEDALPVAGQPRAAVAPSTQKLHFANDIHGGSIMSGRSPYFGAALYLGYITSDFWLFVIAYGVISYLLIILSLRAFGIRGRRALLCTIGVVATLTTAPFYNAYLLADALTGQGILAFLLLAIRGRAFRRSEFLFLVAVLLAATMSHLTHILIILAMALVAMVLPLCGLLTRRTARVAAGIGLATVLIGFASTMVTSAVVKDVFGKPSRLVPLLTARFIADGPGARYIQDHCGEARFAVCSFAGRMSTTSSAEFLWSTQPGKGVFLFADAKTRTALSDQDKQFAWAVLRTYPVAQTKMLLYNTALQAVSFGSAWLNYGCWDHPECWSAVPERQREQMRRTISGRNLWPTTFITALHYTTVIGSILALVSLAGTRVRATQRLTRPDEDDRWLHDAGAWLALLAVALMVNAALGGAISDPQSRYQARVIWLLPFMVWLFAAAWSRRRLAPAANELTA